jgi:orotidine-5'-phosphate decarboxylase
VPGVRFAFDAFALLGENGLSELKKLLKRAGELGFYTILDGPQILSPWAADRAASLLCGDDYPCQGLLISPYIGSDAIKPFVPACTQGDKDLFVVVRSANKSAAELQDLLTGKRLVHGAAADLVNRFGEFILTKCNYSRICAVASAGAADSLRNLRAQYKHMFLLVDGLDYPSGNMKNCSNAFDRLGYGAAISAGPTITAAWKDVEGSDGSDYIEQALQAVERIKKNLQRYFTIF